MSTHYERGRFELKYVLPVTRRAEVLRMALPHVHADHHAVEIPGNRRGYFVHSLYLDTPQLSDYFDRLDEKKVRNRLRIRTYGMSGQRQPVFLEVKRKSGPWVVKHRVAVGDADEWDLCESARPWVGFTARLDGPDRFASAAFLQLVEGAGRVPVSVVHYEREVFVPRQRCERRVRLTLDYNIGARTPSCAHDLFGPAQFCLLPAEWMVMELKFEQFAPDWMVRLRRDLGVSAVPVSKFGLSVAVVEPAAHPRELRALLPAEIMHMGRAA